MPTHPDLPVSRLQCQDCGSWVDVDSDDECRCVAVPPPPCPGCSVPLTSPSLCAACGWRPTYHRTPQEPGASFSTPHGLGVAIAYRYDQEALAAGWYRTIGARVRLDSGREVDVALEDLDIPF